MARALIRTVDVGVVLRDRDTSRLLGGAQPRRDHLGNLVYASVKRDQVTLAVDSTVQIVRRSSNVIRKAIS